MAQARVVILDLETTGLDASQNIILELGIQTYTAQLELIAEKSWIASDQITQDHVNWCINGGNDYVAEMHTRNGLFEQILSTDPSSGKSHAEIQNEAIEWLSKFNLGKNHIRLPLCGSSIHFDRKFLTAQMKELDDQFHYRNIDISSIKELARIYNPELVSKQADSVPFDKEHRVLGDCTASRNELAYYVENLFLNNSIEG